MFAAALSMMGAGLCPGQQPGADAREMWSEYYAARLPRYEFSLDSEPDAILDRSDVRLRWSNPVRPGTHGDLFVWSHRGRGVMVGSIFSYPSGGGRRVAHQFQSLTTDTLVCKLDQLRLFELPGPGLRFNPVPDAPLPSDGRVQRSTQMRSLSRRFEASCLDNSVIQPLRLLNQPLHRFEGDGVQDDGAIFAFVMGTDPELLLVLRVESTDDGPRWHYAAARFASTALKLNIDDQTVWDFNDAPNQTGYLSQHGIDFQPDVPIVR